MKVFSITAIILTFILLSSGLHSLSAYNPTQTADKNDAQKLYLKKCKRCHGKKGEKSTGKIPELRASKMNLNQIISQVTNGKNNMPSFKQQLSVKEIRIISVFVSDSILIP